MRATEAISHDELPGTVKHMPRTELTRRQMLGLALTSPLLAAIPNVRATQRAKSSSLDLRSIINAPSAVVPTAGSVDVSGIKLERQWKGQLCRSRLTNRGRRAVRIKEVVLFDLALSFPSETSLYGEGFQMLSQTGGTLGKQIDLGNYTDAKHYKMPIPDGARCFYGMMTLSPPAGANHLLSFTSCRRFVGQFYFRPSSLQVVLDTEGLELKPGEEWDLEEFMFRSERMANNCLSSWREASREPCSASFKKPPAGWCSWYCFGPRVTATQVLDNLDFIAKNIPGLKYIQIDDGYQPRWVIGSRPGRPSAAMCRVYSRRSAIAVSSGNLGGAVHRGRKITYLRAAPDWFVKDAEAAAAIESRNVRRVATRPWYALDGTHADARKHLEMVFRTMRQEWGCTYFKLDANFWGAIHGGFFNDPRATRVEAYRRGMSAILRGAGTALSWAAITRSGLRLG
jgi:alpha-galactosidase